MLAALAGHLADLQFSFDLTTTGTVFFLLAGLSAALGEGLDERLRVPARKEPVALAAAFGVALVVFGVLGARPLLADAQCGRGHDARRPPAARLAAAEAAVSTWPVQAEYARRLAVARAQTGDFGGRNRCSSR